MKFKRFSAVFALILAVILSLGLLTSCVSETDGTDGIVSIEKDTATETTDKLDFINREPAKDEETTKSPDTTNAPETLGSVEELKSPETEKTPETTKEPETTVHEHNFLLATCTSPKTCLSCGKTEGTAFGHSWESATCTSPKKCSSCSATEGTAKGHSYENGYCTSCFILDPSYEREEMVWVPTKGGTKYHSNSGCSNMDDPRYISKTQAISEGFTACKKCYK